MRTEVLTTTTADAFRGTFGDATPLGAELPPGWEGLLFPYSTALGDLRPDGSPANDGVLPDFDLPRRLYAGEDTVFHRPLRFGDVVEQEVSAGEVVEKQGRAGRLVFADVVRQYRVDGELAIESTWHDVFLGLPDAAADSPGPLPAPSTPADWRDDAALDSRQLFRFSALTFNSHRLHYDREWARDVEGLDDLLVHGPLLRILLLDAACRHRAAAPAEYAFRALAPTYVDRPFRIEGRDGDGMTEVVTVDGSGALLARGVVTWS